AVRDPVRVDQLHRLDDLRPARRGGRGVGGTAGEQRRGDREARRGSTQAAKTHDYLLRGDEVPWWAGRRRPTTALNSVPRAGSWCCCCSGCCPCRRCWW